MNIIPPLRGNYSSTVCPASIIIQKAPLGVCLCGLSSGYISELETEDFQLYKVHMGLGEVVLCVCVSRGSTAAGEGPSNHSAQNPPTDSFYGDGNLYQTQEHEWIASDH